MRNGSEPSWTKPGEHWSLGGMQNKLALRGEQGQWFWAGGASATTHIVKPGVRGVQAQALIEHITMRAAAVLGLTVAPTKIVDFHSERAIVIERFDRARTASSQLVRLHAEDLCQATGVVGKYEEYGGPSARSLATLLRESAATPRQAKDNVTAFVDAVIFNAVIAAPDAHARNYSVLLDGDSVQFAPLYDLATSLAYTPRRGTRRRLSMAIGGCWDANSVGLSEWARFAEELEVDDAMIRAQVTEITDRALSAFREVFDEVESRLGSQARDVRGRLFAALALRLEGG